MLFVSSKLTYEYLLVAGNAFEYKYAYSFALVNIYVILSGLYLLLVLNLLSLCTCVGEVTELDGRLSASRQRVGELEASLKDVTSERDAIRLSLDSLSKEFDTAKMANFKSK